MCMQTCSATRQFAFTQPVPRRALRHITPFLYGRRKVQRLATSAAEVGQPKPCL